MGRNARGAPAFAVGAIVVLAGLSAACPRRNEPAPTAAAPSSATPGTALEQQATSPSVPRLRAAVHEGSAIVRSVEDDALFVADEDHATLHRITLPFDPSATPLHVALPGRPGNVLALAGRLLVTIRDPGLLLVLRPDAHAGAIEEARIALPADAWGLAVDENEHTAFVTSAWSHRVSAVDLDARVVKWSVDVAREPRGIVVSRQDHHLYVSHLTDAERITRIDELARTPRVAQLTLPAAPMRSPARLSPRASQGWALALSPEGDRLFALRHALTATWGGVDHIHHAGQPRLTADWAWAGAGSVDVLRTADDRALVETPALAANDHDVQQEFPLITPGFTQGRALAWRRSTHTLLVASEGDDTLVELDAMADDPALRPKRVHPVGRGYDAELPVATSGAAPSGVALSADEKTAWVWCRATYDLVAVDLEAPQLPAKNKPAKPPDRPSIRLAVDTLPPDAALGRRLFYSGRDEVMGTGMSCAGCHPDGRDDGHTWHVEVVAYGWMSRRMLPAYFAEPPLGALRMLFSEDHVGDDLTPFGSPRQTPTLAGRVTDQGPFGWHAQNATLEDRVIEAFGLHGNEQRAGDSIMPFETGEFGGPFVTSAAARRHARALAAFLVVGLVPPPHEERTLSSVEAHGKQLFESAAVGCAQCHLPASDFTDRLAHFLPEPAPPLLFRKEPNQDFKTPSLRFVSGTAPYFHDGRAATLEQLVEENDDRMGNTKQLSSDDKAALVAYLRTL